MPGLRTAGLPAAFAALDLSELTPFAVALRYDMEFWPERNVAEEAVRVASQVYDAAAAVIGAETASPPDRDAGHGEGANS